jgi:hypothetical protein
MADTPSPAPPGLSRPPAGHWYSLLTCLLAVRILMQARCCLRGTCLLLGVLREHLTVAVPSHETLRRWLLRIGLYVLSRPIPKADDWVWIVDHSAPIGPAKCLLVLGVRQSVVHAKQYRLTHSDVRVLYLEVMARSTGESLHQRLQALVKRIGTPQQIVSDHGSDLAKGIRLLRRDYPSVVDTYDVSHKLACLLKAELAVDSRWQAFLTACARARPRLQQTAGSFLMPPEVRVKARYMSLDRQVRWGCNRLATLEQPVDPRLAGRLGLTEAETRAWVEERLGWLRDFRADLELYAAMHCVIRRVQTLVKRWGLRQDSRERWAALLSAGLPKHPRLQRLLAEVEEYMAAEGAKLPDAKGYLGSSDVIESLFGKHKLFTGQSTRRGLGPNVLLLPLLTVEWNAALVGEALTATSNAAVGQWLREQFGPGNSEPAATEPAPPANADQNQHELEFGLAA